ncbi:MAG: hypothetical protein UZ03_NOB001000302 [Nitrospira sp. OLB3]|nr:MAG: hypothetical protein UZ03_NOB001000302 [Nitrospira sp. OLB3]
MINKDDHPTEPWVCTIRGHDVHYQRRFATRKAAQIFEALILTTRREAEGRVPAESAGAQTFEVFVRTRIAEQNGPGAKLRPSTVAGWESKLRNLPRWFRGKQLHRITARDCSRYLRYLLKNQRRNHHGTV